MKTNVIVKKTWVLVAPLPKTVGAETRFAPVLTWSLAVVHQLILGADP